MKAELRSLEIPEVPDLETWRPADNECFMFTIVARIGVKGGTSEDLFQFTVFSPKWFATAFGRTTAVPALHCILQGAYDLESVRERIEHVVNSAKGDDWEVIADQIARDGYRIFEKLNGSSCN